jgi:hypothetical protein
VKQKSARTVAVLSSLFFLAGLMVMSPSAGFMLMVLAALSAIVPLVLGQKTVRFFGIILLIASLAFAGSYYPQFERERQNIKGRQAHD